MRELLQGFIDMHCHNGPSNVNRLFDTGAFAIEADKAGYKAFITKDHYFPSMMTAMQANALLENKIKTKAYGSLILNNSVGGINLKAVDAACALDVKYVSMPTISSANHIKYYQGRPFSGSKGMILEEKPLKTIDDEGNVTADVEALLQFLSKLEKAPVLATGHGSREEQDAVVRRGTELGVNILVNHPYYGFDVRLEDLERWAGLGAYIELTAICFRTEGGGGPPGFCGDHAFMEKLFEKVSIEQFVLDSDMGQPQFESPVEGVYKYIQLLMKNYGFTEEQINIIGKKTPSKLMHI
jgi:hypothetical protein